MVEKAELYFIGAVEKAGEQEAELKIFPEFCEGIKGLRDFSHLIVLYWMHLRDNAGERRTLLVFPKRHAVNVETGVFCLQERFAPEPDRPVRRRIGWN